MKKNNSNIALSVVKGLEGALVKVQHTTSNTTGKTETIEMIGTIAEDYILGGNKGNRHEYYLADCKDPKTFKSISGIDRTLESFIFMTAFDVDKDTTILVRETKDLIVITATNPNFPTQRTRIDIL